MSYATAATCGLVTGDDGGRLGAMKVMVLQIVAGLVSALLSISRLTLKGQRFGKLKLSRAFRAGRHAASNRAVVCRFFTVGQ